MTFQVRSRLTSPLIFSRENELTRRSLGTGVYSGFNVHEGTPGTFNVSIKGGVCAINGILIEDDADQTNVLALGDPGANDEHHVIYIKWDPDNDATPTYNFATSTNWNTPAVVPAPDAPHSVVIADVWMPNTATEAGDGVITNRSNILLPLDATQYTGIHKMLGVTNVTLDDVGTGNDVTFSFTNLEIPYFSPKKEVDSAPVRFPLGTIAVSTATAGTAPYDYDLTVADADVDDFIVMYIRSDNSFDASTTATLKSVSFSASTVGSGLTELAELVGDATDAVTDTFPQKQNFQDIIVVGVIDTRNRDEDGSTVYLSNGITLRQGDEYNDGRNSAYAQTFSSTAYGTSGVAADANGNVDFDNVLDNAATLHAATLDSAYDSFETGSANGAGRVVTVDSGAIELRNSADEDTPADPWNAALRLSLDYADVNEAEAHERGVDVHSNDEASQRIALVNRRPYFSEAQFGVLLQTTPISLTTSADQVKISFNLGPTVAEWMDEHNGNLEYAESRWITFSVVSGDASDKTYRIRVNEASNYFYLETIDGTDTIISAYPADFTGIPETATGTVWEIHNQIAQTSVVQDLQVQGTLNGPGDSTLQAEIAHTGFRTLQDLIENVPDGGPVDNGINGVYNYGSGILNPPRVAMGREWGAQRSIAVTGKTTVQSNNLSTDGRYVYVVEEFLGGGVPVKIIPAGNLTNSFTLTTNTAASVLYPVRVAGTGDDIYVCYVNSAGTAPVMESWNINTLTQNWVISGLGSGYVTDIILHGQLGYLTFDDTTDNRKFIIFDRSNGSSVWDANAMGLNSPGDANAVMDAWDNKIVVLSHASGGGQAGKLTVMDENFNVYMNDTDLSSSDVLDPVDVLVTDKYIYTLNENTGSGLDLNLYRVEESDTGNGTLRWQEVVAISSTFDANAQMVAAHGLILIKFKENISGTDYSIIETYEEGDFRDPIRRDMTASSARSIEGFDTDGHDLFIWEGVGGTVDVISLGKRGGLWNRMSNDPGTTQGLFISRWLAIPSGL